MGQSYPVGTVVTLATDRSGSVVAARLPRRIAGLSRTGQRRRGNVPGVTIMRLRPEEPADAGAVRRVLAGAFARPDITTPPEVGLVDELRGSAEWLPALAMVAEYGGEVVGYALLTRVRVRSDHDDVAALVLGPVAVAPHRQRIGLGSAVVQAALDAAAEQGERLVVVLGDPAFYRRFGFGRADRLGLTSPWSGLGEPWQARVLPSVGGGPGPPAPGEVIFPPPWSKV